MQKNDFVGGLKSDLKDCTKINSYFHLNKAWQSSFFWTYAFLEFLKIWQVPCKVQRVIPNLYWNTIYWKVSYSDATQRLFMMIYNYILYETLNQNFVLFTNLATWSLNIMPNTYFMFLLSKIHYFFNNFLLYASTTWRKT